MSSENATVAKNLIMFEQIASGTVSFATGATAAATVSADILHPVARFCVSEYVLTIRSNTTQTNLGVGIYNVRPIQSSTAVPFYLANASYTTGLAKDLVVRGMFGGNASAVRLVFSLGTAATAAEIVSADYQVWAYR